VVVAYGVASGLFGGLSIPVGVFVSLLFRADAKLHVGDSPPDSFFVPAFLCEVGFLCGLSAHESVGLSLSMLLGSFSVGVQQHTKKVPPQSPLWKAAILLSFSFDCLVQKWGTGILA
jgi:hypothetical protein